MKLGYSLTRGSHGHGTHNINGLVLSSFLQRFPVQLLQITKTQLDYNWETTCTRTWSLVSRDFNCLKINFYEGVYKVWARVLPQVLLLWDQQVGFHLKVWLSGFFWLQGCVVSSSCTSLIVMKHSITGSQLVRFMILFTVVKVTDTCCFYFSASCSSITSYMGVVSRHGSIPQHTPCGRTVTSSFMCSQCCSLGWRIRYQLHACIGKGHQNKRIPYSKIKALDLLVIVLYPMY